MSEKALSPRTLSLALQKFITNRFGLSITLNDSARSDVPVSPRTMGSGVVKAFSKIGITLTANSLSPLNKAVNYEKLYTFLNSLNFPGVLIIVTELFRSIRSYEYAAESIGNYILFAGGVTPGENLHTDVTSIIDIWDTLLVKQSNLNLNFACQHVRATKNTNYALFGGYSGYEIIDNKRSIVYYGIVECFNSSLTKQIVNLYQLATYMSAGKVGNYCLYMGGVKDNTKYTIVTCINLNLTRSMTNLTNEFWNAASGENSQYCFIGGGHITFEGGGGGVRNYKVEAFNSSLIKYNCVELSSEGNVIRESGGNKNYWVVPQKNNIDIYNTSLTKSTLLGIGNEANHLGCGFSNYDKYIFFGVENKILVFNELLQYNYYNTSNNFYSYLSDGGYLDKYMFCGGLTNTISNNSPIIVGIIT